MMKNPATMSSRVRGVGMIEILITVLVLSVGLLGLAALQGFSLKSNQTAHHRTIATNIASELLDHMRVNRRMLRDDAALPAHDIARWQARTAAELPGGVLTWNGACGATGEFGFTITWVDDRSDEDVDPEWVWNTCTRL